MDGDVILSILRAGKKNQYIAFHFNFIKSLNEIPEQWSSFPGSYTCSVDSILGSERSGNCWFHQNLAIQKYPKSVAMARTWRNSWDHYQRMVT